MSLDTVFKLSVIVGMIDNLTGPISRVNSTVDNSVGRLEKMNQNFGDMAKTGLVMAGVGTQIAATALAPVQATFETRKALGELSSLGIKDLKGLENAAKDFSNTWAGTTKAEFISAAYDIKSGIASLSDTGVSEYTELSGLTAKATKSTIGEMTSLFATGYGIYKDFYKDMSDIEFGEMFSAGISKSVQQFKTTGSGMAQAIQTLGASATTAKVPLEEQLSVLGMLQATMSGGEAGTKYKAFLASAAKAGKELGLNFTDANNQLLSTPEIVEKIRGKFGETMDAAEKMQLQKAFGTDEAVAMVDLMYNKTGQLQDNIVTLYDNMGQGTKIATDMANAINQTEGEKYVTLLQQFQNVKEEIGNQLLPTFNQLLGYGNRIIGSFSNWIGNNKELVKILSIIILTIGILLTTAGTLITVVGTTGLIFTKSGGLIKNFVGIIRGIPDLLLTIRIQAMYAGDGLKKGFGTVRSIASTAVTGIKNVTSSVISMGRAAIVNGVKGLKTFGMSIISMGRQAIVTAATAMPGLIASVWSFTTALLANPVTWVVVGIIALIAAIILLWQNWDSVVAWIQTAWNGFVNGIKAGFDWVRNLFSGMPVWLQVAIAAFLPFIGIPMLIINNWGSIVGFFASLWIGIKGTFTNGMQSIKDFIMGSLTWFRQSGAKILTTFTEGIKSTISSPVEAVKGGLAKIRQMLPFSDAKEGPLSTLTLSGKRVFETINSGMVQTKDLPSETTEQAFSKMNLSARDKIKKINLKEVFKERSDKTELKNQKNNGTNIDKLYISVDISKLKDLPALFKLLEEIEDYKNGNGTEPEPA